MAAREETKIPLKLVIDKAKDKVVFAEADKDFVDALFSFLTLPISTIVRLVGKNSDSKPSAAIGSLSSLYEGLASLHPKHFWTEEYCKDMLLHPKNTEVPPHLKDASEADCCKLKLNIDDTHPPICYVCKNCCRTGKNSRYSTYKSARCNCRELMNTDICQKVSQDYTDNGKCGSVFVTDTITYIVTDDLSVMPNAPSSVFELLNGLGIKDMSVLEERTTKVGLNEILKLLKWSLSSESPLTNLFLCRPIVKTECRNSVQAQISAETTKLNSKKITLRVIVKKSDKKVLFAEAGEDFVDFIFSFLIIPLGCVGFLLKSKTCMGSIDNLYTSLSSLKVGGYLKESRSLRIMTDFYLPYYCICTSQLFPSISLWDFSFYKSHITNVSDAVGCHTLEYLDPRRNGLFIKGPGLFMVTDDLSVTPFSSISSFSIMNQLGNPLSDIEKHDVSIGVEEGLSILKASLTSTSALTNGLNHLIFKKPKLEN